LPVTVGDVFSAPAAGLRQWTSRRWEGPSFEWSCSPRTIAATDAAHLTFDASLLLIRGEDNPDEWRGLIRKPKPAVLVIDKNGHDIDRLVRISLIVGQSETHNALDTLNPRRRPEFAVRPVFHLREYGPQIMRRSGQLLKFHALTSTVSKRSLVGGWPAVCHAVEA
jgi:hypothetical protein